MSRYQSWDVCGSLPERRGPKAGASPAAAAGLVRDSSGWVHVLLSSLHRGAPIST